MKTDDFDYELPSEVIAQYPIEPRDSARLLLLNRQTGELSDRIFSELGNFLTDKDVVVINETRVIPARLFGRRIPTGGRIEILLLRKIHVNDWEVLIGGKSGRDGQLIQIDHGPSAQVVQSLNGAQRVVRFSEPIEKFLPNIGHVPLPPYIHQTLNDPDLYQTVYAKYDGSAAAPTAGMHFTPQLMEGLKNRGINIVTIVLHIGLDTFAPVKEDNPQAHAIHTEWCQVSVETKEIINKTREHGGRIIAVGTTSVRALESAARDADAGETVGTFEGKTDLFILPGYKFRSVDGLITNFHLPRSTLLMLVSAFAGREKILEAYQHAIRSGYRFYSFGDAMFIY